MSSNPIEEERGSCGGAVSAAFLVAISLFFAACSKSTAPGSSNDIVFPDRNVKYSVSVQPLFNRTCAFSGCHDDGSQAGGLSLTSYFNATARPGTIIPGDPDHSILIERVEGRILPRMPYGRDTLTANQQVGLRQWVLEEAKNN